MFDFLPPFLKRLYRSFRVPYARGTRVRETPEPDPEIAVSMRERMFRVEIIQDAFCERRPKPQRLFRRPSGHRNMESWCDLEVSRHPGARHRCAHCTETRDLFKRANDGEWQAEVRLHRLATRASMRLLAQRRAWTETRRRQRAARTPEPGPPPVIWVMLGWKRWRDRKRDYPPVTDRWFIVERREAEAKLVRDHTRKLQRASQRCRARRRDAELARARDAARDPVPLPHPVMAGLVPAIHDFADVAEESKSWMTGTSPVMTGGEPTDDTDSEQSERSAAPAPSSRGAQRCGDPGQRDKRPSRAPGSPRRQKAARDDEAAEPTIEAPARGRDDEPHAPAPSDPPAEAAPAETAPAIAPASPEPAPAPRIALIPYPPGSKTIIRIGAARLTIRPPRRTDAANREPGADHDGIGPSRHDIPHDASITRPATRRAARRRQAEEWHRWPRPNDSS